MEENDASQESFIKASSLRELALDSVQPL